MNTFLQKLEDIAFDIKEMHPYVNSGGCGFLANFFYQHLMNFTEVSDVKIKSVLQYCTCKDFKEIPLEFTFKMFNKQNRIPTDINDYYNLLDTFDIPYQSDFLSHLVCTFKYEGKEYYVDADYGVLDENDYIAAMEGIISNHSWDVKFLNNLLKEPNNWNDTFSRSSVIYIEKYLTKKFSKLKQILISTK